MGGTTVYVYLKGLKCFLLTHILQIILVILEVTGKIMIRRQRHPLRSSVRQAHRTLFNVCVPIDQRPGQAVLQGRLSLNV